MSKFYFNDEQESYDAIVVGSGISGGWAAKELCENGLKTLVLERGPMKIMLFCSHNSANEAFSLKKP